MIQNALFVLLGIFSCLLALVRQYQMLQQNSYFARRYFNWLKGNFSPLRLFLRAVIIGLLVWAAVLGNKMMLESLLLFSGCALYFGWKSYVLNSSSIKKLVFTARVKRMFVLSSCLLLGVGASALLTEKILQIVLLLVLYLLILVPEVLCFISLAVLSPVERAISKHYIKDAKKILSSIKGLKVIGITGSYGKTGTKYILTRILSEKYNTLCTPESFNTPMGVVRTIREKMRADTEIFISEMGAKKKGDIKEICDIVNPDHGIITSVGPQHLDTFGSIEAVADTKFELLDAVNKKGGMLLANGDNQIINQRECSAILYGTCDDFSFKAENISGGREGVSFDLVCQEDKIRVSSKLLGRHNVLNILGASALAYKLGVPLKDISFAISRLTPVEHRLELKSSIAGSLLIDDAYNSNPEGCLEAVNVLDSFEGMKKVIITPGLVELGEKEYDCNFELGKKAGQVCDKIILVGKNRSIPLADGVSQTDFDQSNLFVADSFKNAMEIYSQFADGNTIVLLENDLPDNYLN